MRGGGLGFANPPYGLRGRVPCHRQFWNIIRPTLLIGEPVGDIVPPGLNRSKLLSQTFIRLSKLNCRPQIINCPFRGSLVLCRSSNGAWRGAQLGYSCTGPLKNQLFVCRTYQPVYAPPAPLTFPSRFPVASQGIPHTLSDGTLNMMVNLSPLSILAATDGPALAEETDAINNTNIAKMVLCMPNLHRVRLSFVSLYKKY